MGVYLNRGVVIQLFFVVVLATLAPRASVSAVSYCTRAASTGVALSVTTPEHKTSDYVGLSAGFGGPLPANSSSLPLATVKPHDACAPITSPVVGHAVVVDRGNCSFVQKAVWAQAAGALLVIVRNSQDELMEMECDEEDLALAQAEAAGGIHVAAVLVTHHTGTLLQIDANIQSNVTVARLHFNDAGLIIQPALIVLLLAAVGTIVTAASWAIIDSRKTIVARRESESTSDGDAKQEEQVEVVHLTETVAASFVFTASCALIVMYFLSGWVFYVLLGMFCIGGAMGVHQGVVVPLKRRIFQMQACQWRPPAWSGCTLYWRTCWIWLAEQLLAGIPVSIWVNHRHESWSWLLQDTLSVLFMIHMLRTCRLPNMKVASILLPMAFCYDVFWVFLQPRITGSQSVMVAVATGANSHHEPIPLALRVPQFAMIDGYPGALPNYSMLGYGDVVLPGMLCVYLLQFDNFVVPRSYRSGYFLWCVVGYATGMLITYAALYFNVGGQGGQPALLYLVPCTLGLTTVVGAWRGELRMLWAGKEDCVETDSETGQRELPQDDMRNDEACDSGSTVDNHSTHEQGGDDEDEIRVRQSLLNNVV